MKLGDVACRNLSGEMRPPANRAMKSLNRAFFRKRFPISAARIFDNKNISSVRQQLVKSKDTLGLERLSLVQADPELEVARKGRKCVLLRPALKHDGKYNREINPGAITDQSSKIRQHGVH